MLTRSKDRRDHRLDLFRGIALLCILFDHIPGSHLGRITLKNYGFCDAAEVFVLIAGISSAMAYAYTLNDSIRLAKRIRTIYFAQIALVLATALILYIAHHATGNAEHLHNAALSPFLTDFWQALLRTAAMDLQPENVDILPMYVALLMWLAVFLRIAERSRWIAFAISFGLWAMANALQLNIPGHRNGGWYFNPLAWQFLLSIGVLIGLHVLDGPSRKRRSLGLLALACGYLAFAFICARPWAQYPVAYLRTIFILPPDFIGPLNKSYLSPWRLFNVVALAYVASEVVPRSAAWIKSNPVSQVLIMIGRLPLTSFVAASLFSTIGSLVLPHVASSLLWNVIVTLIGASGVVLIVRLRNFLGKGHSLHLPALSWRLS
jgi:hypothetical protein